ncbi:MAG: lysine--tRNA ligase, partial [Candidatus Woesebacteria bacterium]|nr:lysine--tRNA ligase [Candidatus Woesebacteria bacterium]
HWKVIGVTIEGAGKDHASAGGSYDIAMAICKEVFNYPEPYKLPYEFILIGGKKMSSSKGVGLKAHDLVKILPAEVARFLFVNADIGSQSNFDPIGTMAIPDLFDAYDKAWEAGSRSFVLSQVKNVPEKKEGFVPPRFRDIANYLSQGLSEKEIEEKMSQGKNEVFEERIKYAKIWLENYAPHDYRFGMTKEIPKSAKNLSSGQKEYLAGIAKLFEKEVDADSLQVALYNLSKELKINPKDAFASIYLAFIDKTHGPRAGALLANFGKEKVVGRITSIMKEGDKNG